MSIVIPEARSRTGVTLGGQRVRSSRPLAWLTIAAFSGASAASAAVAVLAHRRDALWATAVQSQQRADIAIAETATDRALLASRLAWLTIAVAALIVAAWSRALVRNAGARGVTRVRPNRTAMSWFVPLVGPAAAIREIGRLVREFDYSERRLWFWLFGFHVFAVVMLAGQIVVTVGFHVSTAESWSAEAVHRQAQVFMLQAAMSVVLTLLAARAIRHADRAVSSVGSSRRSAVDGRRSSGAARTSDRRGRRPSKRTPVTSVARRGRSRSSSAAA